MGGSKQKATNICFTEIVQDQLTIVFAQRKSLLADVSKPLDSCHKSTKVYKELQERPMFVNNNYFQSHFFPSITRAPLRESWGSKEHYALSCVYIYVLVLDFLCGQVVGPFLFALELVFLKLCRQAITRQTLEDGPIQVNKLRP